jgi:hypothetical protein
MVSLYVWFMVTISLSKVSNMTSEKKAKSQSSDRQRAARDQAVYDSSTVKPILAQRPEAAAWHEQAAFHVTLDHLSDAAGTTSWQTHAYHEETGDERVLPGVLDHVLIGWMRERAGLSPEALPELPAEPVAAPAPVVPAEPPIETAPESIGLSVGALELIEQPTERQIGGDETGGRLCAQVRFDLTGPSAYLATTDLRPYAIQVLALDVQDAKSVPLASLRRDLQPQLLGYVERLDLDLPPIGSYQLIANVVLSDDDTAAVALGPVLNVVP